MNKTASLLLFLGIIISSSFAENGSRLWLRFDETDASKCQFSGIIGNAASLPYKEFQRAWREMTTTSLPQQKNISSNTLIIGTLGNKTIQSLKLLPELTSVDSEGYIIRSIKTKTGSNTVVAAKTDAGLLYGIFHLLRLTQTNHFTNSLNIIEKPSYSVRVLNHWDNIDGSVERGYAGRSIWKWDELPDQISPRYQEYARANASIGINATVLNNVNASPQILSSEYLQKVKAIAGVLRPYHIRVYLSINFSSPKALGGLSTSDPLDNNVCMWWANKAKEIYKLIPDFGGFLVKANSEGLPGPMDYGRTHVDGANMLADALKPYGGIVMWRAFVYEPGDDRAKLAYNEFVRYDGQFRQNVIIQVKNGPIDFQPREPFSPLFGAMVKTKLMPEFQITQEYLGQSNHLVFLSSMWEECLNSDTYCNGKGSTIAKITDGTIFGNKLSAIAGVSNIGEDTNWCGHHFAQANWYAFGRLAWNNKMTSAEIADEWMTQTFQTKQNKLFIVNSYPLIEKLMLTSHQTAVNYMMPLGLHHIFAWNHHYGPEPWCEVPGARPDWLPSYYHKADSIGLGFNRTTSGSNAVSQYRSPLKDIFNDPSLCPDKYLLWFHHVPWNFRMKSQKMLWEELCYTYEKGVLEVRNYQKTWEKLKPMIDAQRYNEVQTKLQIQAQDAVWWKEACLLYFQTFSKQAIPSDIEAPKKSLENFKKIKLELTHHN